ncbi:MAG TPA: TetR/AcrR family transcriptional regulator [Bryobacteraceae bacterium]|nr:TetR/AcrR family transcriptional regulator [Bryobacteraceae bacterium]
MATKRPYHHGNLKPVLLQAAVGLIAEVGPAAFTLREVARRAGISHNAPYRHFREKDELLAAVATEGFERLAEALGAPEKPTRTSTPTPALRRFQDSGLAYIRFALSAPEHLLVMFDWPLATDRYPELSAAAKRAFSVLVGLVEAAQREGSLPGGDPLPLACIAWSLVHGVAKLAIAHRLPFKSESEILRFAAGAIEALHQGMAPTQPLGLRHRGQIP